MGVIQCSLSSIDEQKVFESGSDAIEPLAWLFQPDSLLKKGPPLVRGDCSRNRSSRGRGGCGGFLADNGGAGQPLVDSTAVGTAGMPHLLCGETVSET